ncbi:unknown protein [Parachlamydia acanthamoebae UV-7]|uniref:Uncharacterized protein n=2 Tax=Parachlamydia acanthamoebae TaxID=83552 RepID=F8KZV5_PARAV|nr:hypothetical protein [Parachlamydia acanthamoebae]KIA77761.1 hypothetical protein DB43_FS00020 [Parachlamydia acanthamoebae]CCB86464.1 unknown protein [Parachlamydia acanthamoebae UV-7]
MTNFNEIISNTSKSNVKTLANQDAQLICKWSNRKQEADNGLGIAIFDGLDAIGSIQFEMKDKCTKDEGYENLLSAKIFETFGVYNAGIAAASFTECLNTIVVGVKVTEMKPEKAKIFFQKHCENLLSIFQEMRPRDLVELMMVTKMIILDYLSNREFIESVAANSEEKRTTKQIRGIKLSRLLLEFKDKFNKYRKPQQEIHVQHNHIYNQGQAIIGSHLSTEG